MKKIIAILLLCVMALGIAPIVSMAEEPAQLKAAPFGIGELDGWEYWSSDSKEENKRVQLLVEVQNGNGVNYKDCDWKITFKSEKENKTVTLKSTSQYDYNDRQKMIYRFEPCDAEGNNRFIPTRYISYTISAEISRNGKLVAVLGETEGFKPGVEAGPTIIEPDAVSKGTLENGVLTITGIGLLQNDDAWKDRKNEITKIIIGKGITGVGDKVFENYSSVKEIIIGSDCRKLGNEAFANCSSLVKVTFNSWVATIGDSLFKNARSMNEVVLDSGMFTLDFKTVCSKSKGNVDGMGRFLWNKSKIKVTEMAHLEPYAKGELDGWENWSGDGQTNLLCNIHSSVSYADCDWKVTVVSEGEEKVYTWKSSSQHNYGDGRILYRFHPCTEKGENQFIPKAGTDYAIQMDIIKDGKVIAQTSLTPGFKTAANFVPIVPDGPGPEPTPDDGKLLIEPWGGPGTNGSWENSKQDGDSEIRTQFLIVAYSGKFVQGNYQWKLTFNDGTTKTSIVLRPSSIFDVSDQVSTQEAPDGAAVYRFQPCNGIGENKFVPVAGTDFKLTVQVLSNGNVVAESAETEGFGVAANFKPIVSDKPAPTPDDGKLLIEPWGEQGKNGSWENSKQDGDSKPETQFIIVAYDNRYITGDYQWKLTFNDGTTKKTVVLNYTSLFNITDQVPKDQYPNGGAVYRFQPCNAKGENKFVPTVGTNYSLTVQVMSSGTVVAESDETEGFGVPAGFRLITPDEPNPKPTVKDVVVIEPYGDSTNGESWENWMESNQTELLIVAHSDAFVNGNFNFRITIHDGKGEITLNLKPTSTFDFAQMNPGEFGPAKYPDGIVLYRFEPCIAEGENKFIPSPDTAYSISLEILQNGKVISKSESTPGFDTRFDFQAVIDGKPAPEPTPIPHPDVKPDPEPKPTPSEKPEPTPTPSKKPEPKPTPSGEPEPKPVPSEEKKPSAQEKEENSNTGVIVTVIVIVAVVVMGAIIFVVIKKNKK